MNEIKRMGKKFFYDTDTQARAWKRFCVIRDLVEIEPLFVNTI